MIIRATQFAVLACLAVTPALAGGSGQNSAQSIDHSALAVGHGSAAIGSAAVTVVAVPIVAFGSVVAVSGSALAEVGEGTMAVGTDLYRAAEGHTVNQPMVKPNDAPTLD